MAKTVCPECYDGVHSECIGQGCYCSCQLDVEGPRDVECEHGLVRSMCEQYEQEEQ